MAAPDRSADAGRWTRGAGRPSWAFAGVRPGMRVADLGAGGDYTTELLERTAGPQGTVYGQNSRFILDRFAENSRERSADTSRDAQP